MSLKNRVHKLEAMQPQSHEPIIRLFVGVDEDVDEAIAKYRHEHPEPVFLIVRKLVSSVSA